MCSVSEEFGPSVVVHTSVPFSLKHLEQAKEEVQAIILQELQMVLPGFPEPETIKCQKWRYSQVIPHLFMSYNQLVKFITDDLFFLLTQILGGFWAHLFEDDRYVQNICTIV